MRRIRLFALAALSMCVAARAEADRGLGPGYSSEGTPWAFLLPDRPVKVVVVAGSIGAFRDHPYARVIHDHCPRAEVRNISRVGKGAYDLYEIFRREVLASGKLRPQEEAWLWWNGGLNSASVPQRSDHYMRRAFRDAHRHGMNVIGMTLSPWGSLRDNRRWAGTRALGTFASTRTMVDFVRGVLSPREALGNHVRDRDVEHDAPWTFEETPDIRIDLFDSPLRDREAEPRDLHSMLGAVARDPGFRKRTQSLAPQDLEVALVESAQVLAEVPQWFLRSEYRGFDPIHPNRRGHQRIAELACPQLPQSWGCDCAGLNMSGVRDNTVANRSVNSRL